MNHLAERFRGGALARAAMPRRSAASRSFLEEELGANGSFAGRQHGGVLADDFERTRVILRGHDGGLRAHVGPDFQCGFTRNARPTRVSWRTTRAGQQCLPASSRGPTAVW